MIYFLDAAYPPTKSQAAKQLSLGWSAYGGYLGGPRAAHAWTNADFGRLSEVGFSFIPIYVGRTTPYDEPGMFTWDQGWSDGLEADGLAGSCGFNEHQLVCLDAEYGDYQNEPDAFTAYLQGWVAAVNGAGHPACLYSDPRTIAVLGVPELVDYTWAASYVANGRNYTRPPVGYFDPAQPPPWDAWQFADNGYIAGMTVDLNSARDSFPFAVYTAP